MTAAMAAVVACAAWSCSPSSPHRTDTPQATIPPASDETVVRELIAQQADLHRAERWDELYDKLSPSQQAACSRERYAALARAAPASVVVDQVQVRVEGDTAYVTYAASVGATPIGRATDANPDIYVRIDGQWYDEIDTHSPRC